MAQLHIKKRQPRTNRKRERRRFKTNSPIYLPHATTAHDPQLVRSTKYRLHVIINKDMCDSLTLMMSTNTPSRHQRYCGHYIYLAESVADNHRTASGPNSKVVCESEWSLHFKYLGVEHSPGENAGLKGLSCSPCSHGTVDV